MLSVGSNEGSEETHGNSSICRLSAVRSHIASFQLWLRWKLSSQALRMVDIYISLGEIRLYTDGYVLFVKLWGTAPTFGTFSKVSTFQVSPCFCLNELSHTTSNMHGIYANLIRKISTLALPLEREFAAACVSFNARPRRYC